MLLWSDGKFGLNDDDEVGDAGGEHARQSAASYLKHSTPGDRLRVVDDVHDLLNVCSVLGCEFTVV